MGLIAISFVIFITSLQIGLGTAINIEIKPDTFSVVTDNSVHISCSPDDNEVNAKEMLLLEIVINENKNKPIVFIRGSQLSYNYRNKTNLEIRVANKGPCTYPNGRWKCFAQGHIDKEVMKSYLNVTLLNPTKEDSGVYTCVMYVIDEFWILKEKRANMSLTELDLALSPFEKILLQEISMLKEKDSMALTRFKTLEEKMGSQSKEILGLTDKVTYMSAFAVTSKSYFTPVVRQTLVLPNVITSIGKDYDVQTGIFTASRAGLYQFTLFLLTYNKGNQIQVELRKNHVVISKLNAKDADTIDQSSINALVSMDTGDTVKPVVTAISGSVKGTPWTVYSGFLVKLF